MEIDANKVIDALGQKLAQKEIDNTILQLHVAELEAENSALKAQAPQS